RLDQEVARDMTVDGGKRLAYGKFLGAAAGANEQQIDQVHSADQEQSGHATLQEQERRPDLLHVIGVQRKNTGAITGTLHQFRIRIFGDLPRVERVDLRLSLGERRARLQPRDDLQIVGMATLDGTLI